MVGFSHLLNMRYKESNFIIGDKVTQVTNYNITRIVVQTFQGTKNKKHILQFPRHILL